MLYWADYLVLAVVIFLFGLAIYNRVKNRHKKGCCGGCSGCASQSACASKQL